MFSNLGLYQRPFVVTPSSILCTGRVWKHARLRPSGTAGRHPDRTNALKFNRALTWNAAKTHREPPTVQHGQHSHGLSGRQSTSDPTGLYRPIGYTQIRRYGDPTPAVRRKPGSDVSLGSSVPPDRSRGPEHRPCNETHLVTDSRQGIVPANPQLSLRDSWTHSG